MAKTATKPPPRSSQPARPAQATRPAPSRPTSAPKASPPAKAATASASAATSAAKKEENGKATHVPPVKQAAPSGPQPLWPKPIPIIGLTGEFASGKSIFGLTIAPPEKTVVYDAEKSTLVYHEPSFNFCHVDCVAEMNRAGLSWENPVERWTWFKGDILQRFSTGKFLVAMIDPVKPFEDALFEYIRQVPTDFGLTANQVSKSVMLVWAAMKNAWNATLLSLSGKCETLVYTTHMANEFKGGSATGRRKPQGKETLFELATLYLEMQRKPAQGRTPDVPSAVILKDRISNVRFVNGKHTVTPLLPPRLPQATPEAIRQYLSNPLDWKKLKDDEQVGAETMTEEERKILELTVQESKVKAEEAAMARLEKERELEERRAELRARNMGQAATPPAEVDESAAEEEAAEEVPTKEAEGKEEKKHPAFSDRESKRKKKAKATEPEPEPQAEPEGELFPSAEETPAEEAGEPEASAEESEGGEGDDATPVEWTDNYCLGYWDGEDQFTQLTDETNDVDALLTEDAADYICQQTTDGNWHAVYAAEDGQWVEVGQEPEEEPKDEVIKQVAKAQKEVKDNKDADAPITQDQAERIKTLRDDLLRRQKDTGFTSKAYLDMVTRIGSVASNVREENKSKLPITAATGFNRNGANKLINELAALAEGKKTDGQGAVAAGQEENPTPAAKGRKK